MKKISNYFTHGLPYASELRTTILRSQTVDEAIGAVNRYFDDLAEWRAKGAPALSLGSEADDLVS